VYAHQLMSLDGGNLSHSGTVAGTTHETIEELLREREGEGRPRLNDSSRLRGCEAGGRTE